MVDRIFDQNQDVKLQEINIEMADLVLGGAGGIEDAMVSTAFGRAAGGALAALGEGFATGLGAGAWLGPAGAVLGACLGVYVYYRLSRR